MIQTPRFLICIGLVLAGLFLLATTGQTSTEIRQRMALVERAIATAEAAVADPRWVSGPAWVQFTTRVRAPEVLTLDDQAFLSAFNEAARALPFSHFRLHWQMTDEGLESDGPAVVLDWPSRNVAVLQVRAFEGDPAIMSQAMAEVITSSAETLILDLRGTPGGSFPTAVALSQGLRQESVDVGAFLTRGWFAQHIEPPDETTYATIAPLEVLDLEAFREQLRRDGAARLVLPGHDSAIYRGRLFILTDRRTASTAESLTYLLQRNGALVIGERTAGAMLSAEFFPLDETFRLFVPVADYMAPDLVRLDGRGVEPDIKVAPGQALERALAELDAQRSVPQ